MRRITIRLAGFVIAGVMASSVAVAQQQRAPETWTKGRNPSKCFVIDLTMPSDLAGMSAECTAKSSDSNRFNASISAYNAARAYNGSGGFSEALKWMDVSFKRADDSEQIPQSNVNKPQKEANDKFRLGRVYERAVAMSGLGKTEPNPCLEFSRENCYRAAIDLLEKNKGMITARVGDPRYNRYIFALGKAYAGIGDNTNAIENLEKVVGRPEAPGAEQLLAKTALEAGKGAAAAKSNVGQNAAIVFFRKVPQSPELLDARLGLGDAYLWLGENGATDDEKKASFASAATSYRDAAGIATSNTAKARALEGRGKALISASLVPGSNATSLRDEATQVYREWANLESGSYAPKVALARALKDAGDNAGADAAYTEARALLGSNAPAALRSDVLIESAEVKGKLPNADQAAVLTLLKNAIAADGTRVRPNYEAGLNLFRRAQYSEARTYFQAAMSMPTKAGSDDVKNQNEARYYWSLITAGFMPNATVAELRQAVSEAETAGGSEPRFRQVACLARIRRGLSAQTAEADRTRCSTIEEPADYLVSGMYRLRLAQNLSEQIPRSEQLANAAREFDSGGVLAAAAAAATAAKPIPGAPDIDIKVMPVAEMLKFGREIASFCNRSPADFDKFGEPKKSLAIEYFGRFKVYSCSRN